jgi:hypothetical protein
MNRIRLSVSSLTVAVLFVLSALSGSLVNAQNPNINAKPNGKIKSENKAKLPPTVTNTVLVPKLELLSIDKAGEAIKQFNIRITNWAQFPPELFKSEPNLPPNPCGQPKLGARLALRTIRKEDGKNLGCNVVTSPENLQHFAFRTYDGSHPEIYVILFDVKTDKSYKSKVLSTAGK